MGNVVEREKEYGNHRLKYLAAWKWKKSFRYSRDRNVLDAVLAQLPGWGGRACSLLNHTYATAP